MIRALLLFSIIIGSWKTAEVDGVKVRWAVIRCGADPADDCQSFFNQRPTHVVVVVEKEKPVKVKCQTAYCQSEEPRRLKDEARKGAL